jgi:Zn-dependent M28 family amino/carboxypeptidase
MTPRLSQRSIGDAFTSSFAWEVLEDLVEVENRMAGQAGEREGAEIVTGAFEAAGLREVDIEEFDLPGWWRESSALVVPGRGKRYEADHRVVALPGTPAGEREAELVDVGYGVPGEIGDEVNGKIAMARSDTPPEHDRWHHRMEKYAAAAENGAVGFVFRNHVEGCLPPTGEIGYHARPGPIPAVGVSKELGDRLARYADEAPGIELSVDCRNEPTTSPNVSAAVGPDTDEEVLVTAHVDAHDVAEGARDNGVGSALVAEIGRLLAAEADELETKVRLVAFGSEEVGLWGAYHWAETRGETVTCVMNVDGAGDSRTPKVRTTNPFDSMVSAFERAADRLGLPAGVDREVSPHGDSWPFAERGIPAITVGSESAESGRGWAHTHADTLDKLDPRDLRALAAVYAEAAIELADRGTETPRKDPDAIRTALDEYYVHELEAGDRWHFE